MTSPSSLQPPFTEINLLIELRIFYSENVSANPFFVGIFINGLIILDSPQKLKASL